MWQLTITQMATDGQTVKKGDALVSFDGGEVMKQLIGQAKRTRRKNRAPRKSCAWNWPTRPAPKCWPRPRRTPTQVKAQRKASQPEAYVPGVEYKKLIIARHKAEQHRVISARREGVAAEERAAEQRLADADVTRLKADVARIQASVAQLNVKAPRDGIFLHGTTPWNGEKIDTGKQIWRGVSVGEIPDMTTLAMRAGLAERDLTRVKAGDAVRVILEGGAGQTLSGRIDDIGLSVHSKSRVEPVPVVDLRIALDPDADCTQARPAGAGGNCTKCAKCTKSELVMKRIATCAMTLLLAACGSGSSDAPVIERIVLAPTMLVVQGDGNLRSSKSTPLTVPGRQWSQRQLNWMLPDGSWVKEGAVVARFSAEQSKMQLADALVDLQRNALARAGKQDELGDAQGHLAVDLAQVAGQLGIAQRYAHATAEALARNTILDAVQDEHFLGVKQDTLTWRKNSSSTRGKAELALIDAQRATNDVVAKERRDDLDALEIHAPHAGLLVLEADWSGEKPRIGAAMWAGNNFASLPDATQMEVEISVPQTEAHEIKDGVAVELAPLGAPEQKVSLENFLGRRGGRCAQPRVAG